MTLGNLAFLIIYTTLIGVLEMQFHFTVGQIIERLIRSLAGAG